ncbi:UNKNOWN [Stylonychia lemnae]|uniref:Transmembrane protein n=1 Tax=Stylonychia lemnae TaxID=5949 RepID=A0A077ZSL7_STYLE|nr:UNKNOWN [Stylonychia lemnae]|eukprot:CDW72559.1 UNKNOWN [Stylonychia lemnae]
MIFLNLIILTILIKDVQSSTAVTTYDNQCLNCLINNNEFCVASASTYYTTGKCCNNMISDVDYCNVAATVCTFSQTTAGAKYNKCSLSSACGGTTSFFIVKGSVSEKKIQIKASGICQFLVYFVLSDPTTDFKYYDQPSYAQQITGGQDLSGLTGSFVISRDTTTYPAETRYFNFNSVGTYNNLTEGDANSVQYGVAYNFMVAASGPVVFSLKLGYSSNTINAVALQIKLMAILIILVITSIIS